MSADGRVVYCSNRGHDSVVIFAAEAATGMLAPIGWQPTQGRRFISLDPPGRFLYAANEQGDTIVALRVDRRSGTLASASRVVENASPVTIVFASR